MKVFTLVTIALIVVATSALPQAKLNAVSLLDVSQTIKSNNIKLLNEVAILIDSGAPIDDILALLEKIEQDVQDDQASHDDLYSSQVATYEENRSHQEALIEKYNGNILDAIETIAALDAALDANANQIANKLEYIGDLQASIEENQALTEDTIAARDLEKSIYEKNKADHLDAISAIAEVDELLRSSTLVGLSRASAMLAQASRRFPSGNRMSSKLATKSLLFKSIAQSNPQDVSKLLSLLERLSSDLSSALDAATADHEEAQQAYANELASLAAELDNLENLLSTANDNLASLQEEKAQLQIDLQQAHNYKEQNEISLEYAQNTLASLIKAHEEATDFYNSETSRRNEELVTIQECREIIVEKLGRNYAVAGLQ